MSDALFGPSQTQMQTNNEVAAELGLAPAHPELVPQQTPERLFAPNSAALPPELQGVPNALLPNEVAATVPAPQQLMQVPSGATITNFAPQPERAPAVDNSQYAMPQKVEAPQVPGAQMPDGSGVLGTYDTQQRANKAIANAMAQKSTLDEMAQAELEDKVAQSQQKQMQMQTEFDSTFKSRMSDMDNISKQLASQDFTTAKVESNRLWNEMGTGQKILAGLSIALGGYGGALTGKGDNRALDIINKAIDRDIEAQKFNIQQEMQGKQMKSQNLRDQMSSQGTILSSLRQKYGDDLQAESAMRQLAIQQTQLKLQQIASRTESKTVLENAKVLNAQLEREKQVYAQQLRSQVAQQALLRSLGTGAVDQISPVQLANAPKEVREAVERQQQMTVPGLGLALDPEAAKKARGIKAGSDGLVTLMDKIIEVRKSANPTDLVNPASEKYVQLQSLAGELLGAKKEASELGTLDNGVQNLVDKIYKDPTGFNPSILSSYENARKLQIRMAQKKLAPYVGDITASKYSGPNVNTQGLKTLQPK